MVKNLHISFTNLKNSNKILKSALSLQHANLFNEIVIYGYLSNGLSREETISSNIKIKRVKIPQYTHLPHKLKKLMILLVFCMKTLSYSRKFKPDVINIHALELLPLGFIIKKIVRCKLVYDAHELETERVVMTKSIKWIAKIIERLLIGVADLVIVVSPMIENYYKSLYKNINIITVKNCSIYHNKYVSNFFREHFKIKSDTFIYIYSGALHRKRNIPRLIDFFNTQNNNKRVIVFMGDGPLNHEIQASPNYGKTIFWHPAVPLDMVTKIASSADIGIHLGEDICLSYQYCLPNKMFEYLMARIPQIATNLPQMREIIESNGIGKVVKNIDDQTLLKTMETIEKDIHLFDDKLEVAAHKLNWEPEGQIYAQSIGAISPVNIENFG